MNIDKEETTIFLISVLIIVLLILSPLIIFKCIWINVIEVNDTTTLVFTTETLWKDVDLYKYEEILTDKLQCKSIILRNGFKLDKAVEKENKQVNYETTTFYADGKVIREETV